jgi:CRISPR-associated protein Cmr2
MAYLLLIALGPVQDFIATARKTRDLWFGSYLLSEVSKAAAKHLHDQKHQLIFPNPKDPTDLEPEQSRGLNVANIILCSVVSDDEENVKKLAREAIQKAKSRLHQIRIQAVKRAGLSNKQKIIENQIEDLLESYWAITKLKGEMDYPAARRRVSHTLDARKATRTFQQPSWAEAGIPKSSLDGAREIVTPEDDGDHNLRRLGMKKGERLCGVGLVKRLGIHEIPKPFQEKFASTSSIAAATLVTESNKSEVLTYYQELVQNDEVKLFNLTGAALFESRLREFFEDDNPNEKTLEQRLNEPRSKLNELLKKISGGKTPLPYYALLLGDGDNMGKTIDLLTKDGIQAHQQFSSDLAGFATKAREIVEAAHGCLIYAGGDDVLALLPLHTALECALCLNQAFEQAVGGEKYKQKDKEDKEVKPSFSAGMVVWHHLEPLQEALQAARDAEKKAKDVDGKDALCIMVAKRSGADISVRAKFSKLVKHIVKIRAAWVDDQLSKVAAFELRDMVRELEGIPEAQKREASRILNRKKADKKTVDHIIKQLEERIDKATNKQSEFQEFVDELLVARIFADATVLRNIVLEREKSAQGVNP